jgi:LPXTG-motif cell wall-anchored protein
MRAARRTAALLVSALVLGLPGAALAQTPGDEQYQDPFGGQSEPPEPAATAEPAPVPAPEPAPAAPPPSATPAAQAPVVAAAPSQAEQLPYTGADAGLLGLGGAILLAGGIALRVRLREQS